jgi:membrane protein implicated in regulation of membrane protease activity
VNPQDPLANLHPLREPVTIGWWPPAAGWWLLLVTGILAVAVLAYLFYRHRRRNVYRRHALLQLQTLQATHQAQSNDRQYLEEINALLKSVALYAYPRCEVAAQHGESWRTFLNRDLPPGDQFQPTFDEAAYQKSCPEIDMAQVHRAAQHWIRHHKVIS